MTDRSGIENLHAMYRMVDYLRSEAAENGLDDVSVLLDTILEKLDTTIAGGNDTKAAAQQETKAAGDSV